MGRDRRILVVDDERGILELVGYHLRRSGYEVYLAETGSEGFELALAHAPDLIVLDLMLPDMDGFEVCRRIRRHSRVPILILTARADDVDRAVGLGLGADDYLTKPFQPRELLARIRTMLGDRREAAGASGDLLRFAELEVDLARRRVHRAGRELHLTPTEFAVLKLLVQSPGPLSRAEILHGVWGADFVGDSGVVDLYIHYLREKLDDPAPPSGSRWIESLPEGYRWKGGGA